MEDYRYGKNSLFKDEHPFLGTWLFFLIMIVLGFITFYRFGEISRSVRAYWCCMCAHYVAFLCSCNYSPCSADACVCMLERKPRAVTYSLSLFQSAPGSRACVCVRALSLSPSLIRKEQEVACV